MTHPALHPDPMPHLALAYLLAALLGGRLQPSPPRFDGEAAMRYVRAQVAMGPRVPGSEGHRRAGAWLVAEMRKRADTVVVQEWTHVTARGDSLPMRNVLARFRPRDRDRVLYVAHWDTRPFADGAAEPHRRALAVPGANDGASGVALLLAVGDALRRSPPALGVDLLLVDGEDYGDFARREDVLVGSTWFARHPPEAGYRPRFGVLWDMVGDRDLQIYQEGHSARAAPELVERVWRVAEALGHGERFIARVRHTIDDDHLPLLRAGLPVIAVVDYDYPRPPRFGAPRVSYHHTAEDDMDKVSAASLQVVGDIALRLLER